MNKNQSNIFNRGLTFEKPTLDEISKSKFHDIAVKNWYQVKRINTNAKPKTITKIYSLLSEIIQGNNSSKDGRVTSDNLLKHLLILDNLKYLEKYVTFEKYFHSYIFLY